MNVCLDQSYFFLLSINDANNDEPGGICVGAFLFLFFLFLFLRLRREDFWGGVIAICGIDNLGVGRRGFD